MINNKLFDPSHSIVAVAGAGTGKTYSLARRYLTIVATNNPETDKPWASPQEVLAVTFTRAAAAEMRERVVEELNRAKQAVDDSIFKNEAGEVQDEVMLAVWHSKPDYNNLIQSIDHAPIDTLHGLCASLLREFPELCLVPLDARPLEPGAEAIQLERFTSRYIDALLDGPEDDERADIVTLLREVSLERMKGELRAMIGGFEEIPEEWEKTERVAHIRSDFILRQWKHIVENLTPVLNNTIEVAQQAIVRSPAGDKFLKPVTDMKLQLEELLSLLDATKLPLVKEVLETFKLVKTGNTKKALNEKNQDLIYAISDLIATFDKTAIVRGKNILESLSDDPGHAERIACWVRLGRKARKRYTKHLKERSLLRFNDLEDRAVDLLQNEEAKETLKGRFKHILVDEFQDTNEKQVKIIEGLNVACGRIVSFYVGDPKQSIYRFRGAEVEVFMKEINRIPPDQRVELSKTYRTSPDLSKFFNMLFPRLLDPQEAESDGASVPWDEDISCNRIDNAIDDSPVDLLLRVKGKSSDDDENENDQGSSEAERLARYIRSLLESSSIKERKLGKTKQRQLRPKDFSILLPKWNLAEGFRSALESCGVRAELAGGRGLFQVPEVRDLINLIRFWANWDDNLAAAGVLRGPCFGISDLGLYVLSRWPGVEKWEKVKPKGKRRREWRKTDWLSDNQIDGPFPLERPRSLREAALKARILPNEAIKAFSEAGVLDPARKDEMVQRLEADAHSLFVLGDKEKPDAGCGIGLMSRLTALAGIIPTADLLADTIVAFRMEAAWIKSPSGTRAVANAWRFVEMVRQIEAEGPSLSDLVSWIDSESDPTPEGLISGESDAVTITTLHGSKGLEWPVVALAGLGARGGSVFGATWSAEAVPNLDGNEPRRLPRIQVPMGGFMYQPDPLEGACSALLSDGEAAEIKRQLYVAMTRAKDRLILSGDLSKYIGHHGKNKGHPCLKMADCGTHAAYLGTLLDLTPDDPMQAGSPFNPSENWKPYVSVIEDEALQEMGDNESSATIENEAIIPPPIEPEILNWGVERKSIRRVSPSLAAKEHTLPGLGFTDIDPEPNFIEPPLKRDPRALGTLFHAVMEDWNFTGDPPDEARLEIQAERYFPGDGKAHVSWLNSCVKKIDQSELGTELKAAVIRGEVFHEVNIDALIGKSQAVPERLRAKGRIDLLFKDDKGLWCVVDYKETIKVSTGEELEHTAKEYGSQLALYREVIEAWRPGEIGRVGLWLALVGKAWWTAA